MITKLDASFSGVQASHCTEVMDMPAVREIVAVTESQPVHCPMCTHDVIAEVVHAGKREFVKSGQKCPHCSAALDAAYILRLDQAA